MSTEMSTALEYHRPGSLDGAVALLGGPGTVILAGGTWVNAGERPRGHTLIDLQALGLDTISETSDGLVVGAMTTLTALSTHSAVPNWLRDLARREQPSALRTVATVGGTLFACGWESTLLAGLLACDAIAMTVGADGQTEIPVADLLGDRELAKDRIVSAVKLSIDGVAAVHTTARTTADRPIVGCVARRAADGIRLAISGIAATPLVIDADRIAELEPPSDFRGSSEYRAHLAQVLSARAITEIGAN